MQARTVLILSSEQSLQRALDALVGSADSDCEILITDTMDTAEKTLGEREHGLLVLDCAASKEGTRDLLAVVRQRGWRSLVLVEGMRDQTRMQVAGADVALLKGGPAPELLETIIALLETMSTEGGKES
jgi:DNA-binding response OmpR family regulator